MLDCFLLKKSRSKYSKQREVLNRRARPCQRHRRNWAGYPAHRLERAGIAAVVDREEWRLVDMIPEVEHPADILTVILNIDLDIPREAGVAAAHKPVAARHTVVDLGSNRAGEVAD